MPRRKGWEGFPEELRPKGQGVWAVENHRRLFVLRLGERTQGIVPFLSHGLPESSSSLCSLTSRTEYFPL